jgi:tagatose-1,6-bisphosphate aldolase non-catalytic subunit AgaZ/GatZ
MIHWIEPEVNQALAILMKNLYSVKIPLSLISQFASGEKSHLLEHNLPFSPENIISSRIMRVIADYWFACAVVKESK